MSSVCNLIPDPVPVSASKSAAILVSTSEGAAGYVITIEGAT